MRSAWSLFAVLVAQPAFADPFWDPPATPVESYRLEVAAIDAGAVAVAAIGHNSTFVVGLGVATYMLGAPIAHLFHERPGAAVGSLLLRTGVPVLGALIGYAATESSGGGGEPAIPAGVGGAGVGLIAGTIAASAIDIGVLARGDVVPAVAPTAPPFAGGHGGLTFGLAGRF